MKGTLVVWGHIIDKGIPDAARIIEDFVEQAVEGTVTGWNFELGNAMKTMDHPDFDVEDGQYVLVMRDFRDPEAFFNRTFKLYKLERVDADGKHICVKEYK